MTIVAKDVSYTIKNRSILHSVNAECQPGRITALVGPSGSGKTTLLSCLGMLLTITGGQITIDGQDATGWNDARRRTFWRTKAAFIFQDYGLIDDGSVAYNVTMQSPPWWRRTPRISPSLTQVIEHVGLAGRENDTVSVLSGGERQRVGVARAIYKQASYIFADEPTASLDAANREMVTALLHDAARRGAGVIIATHDDELMAHADHLIEVTPQRASVG